MKCPVNHTADPPEDCNWPFCGCDEKAMKVIETLLECGWRSPLQPPVKEDQRDAERYRYLRSHYQYGPPRQHRLEWYLPRIYGNKSAAAQLDEAIDAARGAEREEFDTANRAAHQEGAKHE